VADLLDVEVAGVRADSTMNLLRFSEARLQAVSSRNMYSEHGLLALIRPSAGQVCHSLIVVSNCRPGSAQAHALMAILSHSSRARTVRWTLPSVRRIRSHVLSFLDRAQELVGDAHRVVGVLARDRRVGVESQLVSYSVNSMPRAP
jgi:hypothetical protein